MSETRRVKCMACHGTGKCWIDPRDPIEGNKLRRSSSCECCVGLGHVARDSPAGVGSAAYWAAIEAAERIERDRQKEQEKERSRIMAKASQSLTIHEMQILGIDVS